VECVVAEGVIWREGRATGDDEHVEVSMVVEATWKGTLYIPDKDSRGMKRGL
jgi:hypothetical protein